MSSNSTPSLDTKTPQEKESIEESSSQQSTPKSTPKSSSKASFKIDSDASAYDNMANFKKFCKNHNINLLDDDCPDALLQQYRKLQKDVQKEKETNKMYLERLKGTNTKIPNEFVDLVQNPGTAEENKLFNIFVGANKQLLDQQDKRIRELEEENKKTNTPKGVKQTEDDFEPPKKKRKLNVDNPKSTSNISQFLPEGDRKNMKDVQIASSFLSKLMNKEKIMVPNISASYSERLINSGNDYSNTVPSYVKLHDYTV